MIEITTFDPKTLFLIALLNPAVIAVAFLMGRRADQWQKLIVAAFVASLAGVFLFWIARLTGMFVINAYGAASGLLMLQLVFGLGWAYLGFRTRGR